MFFLSSIQPQGLSFAQGVTRVGKAQDHADIVCRCNTTTCNFQYLEHTLGTLLCEIDDCRRTFCELSLTPLEALSTLVLVTRISAVLAADFSTSDVEALLPVPKRNYTHL